MDSTDKAVSIVGIGFFVVMIVLVIFSMRADESKRKCKQECMASHVSRTLEECKEVCW